MNRHLKTIGSLAILAAFIIALALIVKPAAAPAPAQPNQQVGNSAIMIDNLPAGNAISLPITLTGQVTGNWFFEGSFPVVLQDSNGATLTTGLASTTADWMTTNMIPFSVTIPAVAYQGPASIVFHKDNPSGEAQFDASFSVSVTVQ